jgi:lipid kinase YegS
MEMRILPVDIRLILNGKKAGLDPVRAAVYSARKNGRVDVRTTWESGDVHRLVREACLEGCRRLVAGGGDGTVNELVDAVLKRPVEDRPELAILPLGTANDFATGCAIPIDLSGALELAQFGKAHPVDGVKANDFHFINVASGGFGAQVTSSTPVALKNFLGGGAYTLSGLVQALSFVPYRGETRMPGAALQSDVIVGAVCNGPQAGGGQHLAPNAKIDDGLLDIVSLNSFPKDGLGQVVRELTDPDANGEYVKRFKVPWAEWASDIEMPINLDGEPIKAGKIRFEILPGAIQLVLPDGCPLIS